MTTIEAHDTIAPIANGHAKRRRITKQEDIAGSLCEAAVKYREAHAEALSELEMYRKRVRDLEAELGINTTEFRSQYDATKYPTLTRARKAATKANAAKPRTTLTDVALMHGHITNALSRGPLRSEELRRDIETNVEVVVDKKVMSKALRLAVEAGYIKTQGQKRATTYELA